MADGTSYNVNFFKPSTPFLKENIRAIVIGLVVWAVATYGFQILLKVLETPTPEAQYTAYQLVVPKLAEGTAGEAELRIAANLYLAALGKNTALLKNEGLKNLFTASVYQLLPPSERERFLQTALKAASDKTIDIGFINDALNIADNKAMVAVVPYALTTIVPEQMKLTDEAVNPLLEKYFTHNQSILTDTIVFGFPFHYLYTAIILLVLFVLICLIYCQVIDRMMKKYGMESSYE